jgi:hypothetical protein
MILTDILTCGFLGSREPLTSVILIIIIVVPLIDIINQYMTGKIALFIFFAIIGLDCVIGLSAASNNLLDWKPIPKIKTTTETKSEKIYSTINTNDMKNTLKSDLQDAKDIRMYFDTESMISLKDEIKMPDNLNIRIFSYGGRIFTIIYAKSIIKLLRENNKKIIISNVCKSMCAKFISVLPKDLVIHEEKSELNFHNSKSPLKKTPLLFVAIAYFNNLIINSYTYYDYIRHNSSLSYKNFISMMNETGGFNYVRCRYRDCNIIF